jgi:hypothetical protein
MYFRRKGLNVKITWNRFEEIEETLFEPSNRQANLHFYLSKTPMRNEVINDVTSDICREKCTDSIRLQYA